MTAPILPFAPDGATAINLTVSLLTDIMQAGNGREIRHGMREVPVHTLGYSFTLIDRPETNDFLKRWVGATQPLRYSVPIWPRVYIPSAISGADVTVDRNPGTRLGNGSRVLLWQSDDYFEEAEVDSVATNVITLTAPPTNPFVIGAVRLIPIMTAWVSPPTIGEQCSIGETVQITAEEELEGIAGEDATVTGQATAVATTVRVTQRFVPNPYPPGTSVFHCEAYDADGFQIENPVVTWQVNDTASGGVWMDIIGAGYDGSPNLYFAISPDGQYLMADWRLFTYSFAVRAVVDGVPSP